MDLRDEFAEIVADLRAWMETESLQGARLFPAEPSERSREEQNQLSVASKIKVGRPETSKRAGNQPPPVRTSASSMPGKALADVPEQGPGKWGHLLNQKPAVEKTRSSPQDGEVSESRDGLVFGTGPKQARLMLIGEGLGDHEARQNVPFSGQARQMLDNMLRHVLGFERNEVFIVNVVKTRMWENENADPEEMERYASVLKEQIRICQPKLVLVMGNVACRALFGRQTDVNTIRGKWREVAVDERSIQAMPTFHPIDLLQKPEDKRLSFRDLKALRAALDQADG